MKKKVICIIPARSGSKGIKFKNLAKINSRPLIYYPIEAALKSQVCDKIIVSTDSKKIAKIALNYGAEVPFLRNRKLSGDYVTTEKTLQDCLLKSEDYFKTKFDICVFLTCTNPFRKISWIKYAVNFLKKNKKIDSVFSVHELHKHFWYKKKNYKKILPWMKSYTSRQIGKKLYREDTGIVCATRSKFWRAGKRIGNKVHFIVNKDPLTSIDIHDHFDLQVTNILMKFLKKKKKNDMVL